MRRKLARTGLPHRRTPARSERALTGSRLDCGCQVLDPSRQAGVRWRVTPRPRVKLGGRRDASGSEWTRPPLEGIDKRVHRQSTIDSTARAAACQIHNAGTLADCLPLSLSRAYEEFANAS